MKHLFHKNLTNFKSYIYYWKQKIIKFVLLKFIKKNTIFFLIKKTIATDYIVQHITNNKHKINFIINIYNFIRVSNISSMVFLQCISDIYKNSLSLYKIDNFR